jgi:hypothetical protein
VQSEERSVQKNPEMYSEFVSFTKIGLVKALLWLQVSMQFCLSPPHLLSNIGAVTCKRFASNAVLYLEVRENQQRTATPF